MRTYDDPRTTLNPVASRSLSVENQLSNNPFAADMLSSNPFAPVSISEPKKPKTKLKEKRSSASDTSASSSASATKPPPKNAIWKIGPCDMLGYEMLDDCLTFEDEVPQAARNKVYNRYMDILPNPKTRVNLPKKQDPIDRATEYINANWVVGPNGDERFYIAAMGPKPKTVNTFWRMMWKVKPIAIVMITGLVEKGQPKCERYWPGKADGKEVLVFGDVRVCTTASTPKHGYVRSTIKAVSYETLDVKGKLVSHTMEHFWYNTWPDHGVPRSPKQPLYVDDTLEMMREVNEYAGKKKKKGMKGPIVVHCSAGIGRTGTYIAIDHCLYQLDKTGMCEPLDTVATIRNYRCALVQHPQQFKFAHTAAVRYATLCGKNYEIEKVEMIEGDGGDIDHEEHRRIEKMQSATRSGSDAVVKPMRVNHRSGISMGVISFQGKQYQFIDPDGNGKMDVNEATAAGFPRQLFRTLDKDNDGFITPSEFKTYQRLQKQQAAKNRASKPTNISRSRQQTITAKPHRLDSLPFDDLEC